MMGNTIVLFRFLLHYIHIAKIDTSWQKTIQMGSVLSGSTDALVNQVNRSVCRPCHGERCRFVSKRAKITHACCTSIPIVQSCVTSAKKFWAFLFPSSCTLFFLERRFNLAVVDWGNLARRWGCWWNHLAKLLGQPPRRGCSFLFTDLRSGVDSG